MSLLMQALKKAERAKLNSPLEDEPGQATAALEALLSRPPQENMAGGVEPGLARPADTGLSLSPLERATPDPGTAGPGTGAPGLADDMAAPPWPGEAAPGAPATETAVSEPATLRLTILCGIAVLLVAGFGFHYWQAASGPGPGASLPMVPMPAPDAAPAAMAPAVPAAPSADVFASQAPVTAAPVADVFAPQAPVAAAAAPAAAMPPFPAAPPSAATAAAPAATRSLSPEDAAAEEYRRRMEAPGAPAAPPAMPAAPVHAAAAREPPAAPAARDIKVSRSHAAPQVDPLLAGAYQAFNAGDDAGARRQYEALLRQDPNQRDALLGLAAVALRARQNAQAAALYQRLLELDPDDADAVAGLAGIGQGDPGTAEARLQAQLRRSPDAGPLWFALGNLLAREGRWPQAQQAYFRASGAEPDNADYAFNLAVGLDRLNQGRLARDHYRRALALAQGRPAAFDAQAVQRRIAELGAGEP